MTIFAADDAVHVERLDEIVAVLRLVLAERSCSSDSITDLVRVDLVMTLELALPLDPRSPLRVKVPCRSRNEQESGLAVPHFLGHGVEVHPGLHTIPLLDADDRGQSLKEDHEWNRRVRLRLMLESGADVIGSILERLHRSLALGLERLLFLRFLRCHCLFSWLSSARNRRRLG